MDFVYMPTVPDVHPFGGPHPKSVGYAKRKQIATQAVGGVSRNDPHVDQGNGSTPWQPVALYQPELPVTQPLPVRATTFGRVQVPTEWQRLKLAPDHSKYPIINTGDLGFSYRNSPFFFEDRQ